MAHTGKRSETRMTRIVTPV